MGARRANRKEMAELGDSLVIAYSVAFLMVVLKCSIMHTPAIRSQRFPTVVRRGGIYGK